MKTSIFSLLTACILLFTNNFSSHAAAAQSMVSGTVVAQDGSPVEGVSLRAKGSTVEAVSGANGSFSIQMPAGRRYLEVSGDQIKTRVVSVGQQSDLTVTVQRDAAEVAPANTKATPSATTDNTSGAATGSQSSSMLPGNGSQTPDSTGMGNDDRISGGATIGAISVDGVNYQKLSVRSDVPIGKFGFGLDFELLIDENGGIRKEDWDEWEDYLDKVYFIRYAKKGDPFYIKAGGLDYAYIGYENIMNGYSNMVEYPTVKRYGMEMSFGGKESNLKGELFLNDFKELFNNNYTAVMGGRVAYKVLGDLEIGISAVADLNQFNSLKDADGDGFPDEIDEFENDRNWATKYDRKLEATYGGNAEEMAIYMKGAEHDSIRTSDLFNKKDTSAISLVFGIDIGYPIVQKDNFKMDLYATAAMIQDYGWGTTPIGFRMKIGQFLTLKAEYRLSSKEFIFGYFNPTYEIERAKFVRGANGELTVQTKEDRLAAIQEGMNGFFAGADFNLFGLASVLIQYQDLKNSAAHDRLMRGELRVGEKLLPKGAQGKGYYVQNNVQDFREWKTEATIMGFNVSYPVKGVNLGIDYRWTFQDLDGSGLIRGKEETMKTIGFNAGVKF